MVNQSAPGVVIVGAGQAGAEVATALRQKGYSGSITMIGEERYPPYRRPPLSKAFLAGEATLESLHLKPEAVYQRHGIRCRLGVRVMAIDTIARRLRLSDGSTLRYNNLVLATGGRPRPLPVPGADSDCVHYVRTVDDVLRLREHFCAGARLVLIGGGYIGLETAAVAIKADLKVTVVEAMDRVLARVAAPALSEFYESVHREHGVEILTGAAVKCLETEESGTWVRLTDGRERQADLVIVGVGLIPETRLAEEAGITVLPEGVVVDSGCRTSVPDVYAVGDCTYHENDFYGRHMRVESVPNATEQARALAATLCDEPIRYAAVPWFWSDQYGLKLQMVGLSEGYDELVIRGERASRSFIAFYLREGVLISADAVNRPQDFMIARRLVAARAQPAPDDLAREDRPLKALVESKVV
ncbi:NAD(P)/FAD-dependent oxidoreductase [Alloalcanivorax mobilis]|uniref:NAD(P)/FAD-dependent oxidoreductase n=1 Tax=Alloalcanivorax mobilis TaxID=2019569 RepID=UPI000C765885|nr:FAD-dependent oxidoreductase [Alloalcanivorax mobilis]